MWLLSFSLKQAQQVEALLLQSFIYIGCYPVLMSLIMLLVFDNVVGVCLCFFVDTNVACLLLFVFGEIFLTGSILSLSSLSASSIAIATCTCLLTACIAFTLLHSLIGISNECTLNNSDSFAVSRSVFFLFLYCLLKYLSTDHKQSYISFFVIIVGYCIHSTLTTH